MDIFTEGVIINPDADGRGNRGINSTELDVRLLERNLVHSSKKAIVARIRQEGGEISVRKEVGTGFK